MTVLPETNDVISSCTVVNQDKLIITYLKDVKDVCNIYSLYTGAPIEPRQLPLPMGSIIGSFSGRRKDKELFYSFSSFTTPGEIHRFDFDTNKDVVFRETKIQG